MKSRLTIAKIIIGITDCSRYGNYERWFLDSQENIDVIRLSYRLKNLESIKRCHGIVLSGGEDIDPRRYKRPDLVGRVELTDIDIQRDDFEVEVIRVALKEKLPILGICRGMQLFNVYHGGTLIFDIPSITKIHGHGKIQGIDQRHEITVGEKTLLSEITGCLRGAVNSAHHQCVEIIGNNLIAIARAEEPIIEAMQWKSNKEHPFYLGVQWHPERMVDQSSPFSLNIRQAFIKSIVDNLLQTDQFSKRDEQNEIENQPPKIRSNNNKNI